MSTLRSTIALLLCVAINIRATDVVEKTEWYTTAVVEKTDEYTYKITNLPWDVRQVKKGDITLDIEATRWKLHQAEHGVEGFGMPNLALFYVSTTEPVLKLMKQNELGLISVVLPDDGFLIINREQWETFGGWTGNENRKGGARCLPDVERARGEFHEELAFYDKLLKKLNKDPTDVDDYDGSMICAEFSETGHCQFGDACRFIHRGKSSARQPQEKEKDTPQNDSPLDEEEEKGVTNPKLIYDWQNTLLKEHFGDYGNQGLNRDALRGFYFKAYIPMSTEQIEAHFAEPYMSLNRLIDPQMLPACVKAFTRVRKI